MTLAEVERGQTAAALLLSESGQNVMLCYQCQKCTVGCPLAAEMDLPPNYVMRALQWNRLDQVLRSRTIWICASCQTCNTRCPSGIDVAKLMDSLKILAQRLGVEPRVPSVAAFISTSLASIRRFGRLYELGTALGLNRKSGQLFRDAGLGFRMFRKGKMKLLPRRAHLPRRFGPMAPHPRTEADAVAYYPGCSLHGTASEFDRSLRAVAAQVGLKLEEPRGWGCCGSTPAHWSSHHLATVLPMKNLALVEAGGRSTVTAPCALCFLRLRRAIYDVEHDATLRQQVAEETGYLYSGGIQVEHTLDTFISRVGLPAVTQQVKKPLKGLKVVCYFGCLLTRPPDVTGAADPEYPTTMDRLIRALGAQPLDWSYKTECCGGSHSLAESELALGLCEKILRNAREVGAEAVVVACPMCHANLDARQEKLADRMGEGFYMPIFYFTQLMAIAFGLGERDAGLGQLMVDPRPLLRAKGLE